eukprot:297726-Pleurochrysis_carterae.AAC.1
MFTLVVHDVAADRADDAHPCEVCSVSVHIVDLIFVAHYHRRAYRQVLDVQPFGVVLSGILDALDLLLVLEDLVR